MEELTSVNPEVLKWARESAGMTIQDVVLKMKRKKITYEIVHAWETGEKSPSYPQLERLAYELYKRPLALFFFPSPPEEVTPKQSFRTLPEYEINNIPREMRLLLRKAQSLQLNLIELYDGVNPSERKILDDLHFDVNLPLEEMGKTVRNYLSVDMETQTSLGNPENAFKFWRNKLEQFGIFVFKDTFKNEDFSGFCLYDNVFPIIYINNSKPPTRQIFTLFHELAHLFFETGGIDTQIEDYIEHLQGENRQIEILCNKFSGEFLVPSDDFDEQLKKHSLDFDKLSSIYHVSKEVLLRKALEKGLIDRLTYEEQVNMWKAGSSKKTSNKAGGPSYYLIKSIYLGEKYIERSFAKYYQNRISMEELAGYLGVKVKNLPGMEAQFGQMGSFE